MSKPERKVVTSDGKADATAQTSPVLGREAWTGWVVSTLPVLFLLFDSGIHLAQSTPAMKSFMDMGFDTHLVRGIGLIEVICLALYIFPNTSVLGAILLTGYLGGAVATHVRIGSPLFGYVLFPIYVGALLWTGLYLRNRKLRDLLPVVNPDRR